MSGQGERIEPAAATVPTAGTEPPAATPPAPVAPAEDWRDKRIAQMSGKLHERNEVLTAREARIAELEAEITTLRPAVAAAAAAPAPSEAEIERRIETEAARRAAELSTQQTATIEFNRRCNEAVEQGRQQFPDFDTRLGDLRSVIIPGDRQSEEAYWGVVSAALKSGAAPKVIHALGTDKAEAMRIFALEPEARAMEIAKLAFRAGEEGEALPKPITPVGSKGSQHTQIDPTDKDRADNLNTKEWMKRREQQVTAAAGASRR